ncbi:MAG TPA: hypothetical protein VFC68_07445 [Treponemataceae bacterium]|nr:hypothetical protein [Treponemataceae bacterium]
MKKGMKMYGAVIVALLMLLATSCEAILDTGGSNDTSNTPDIYEDNDARGDAYTIEQGKAYNATISDVDDDDWFFFGTAHSSDTYDKMQIKVTNVSAELCIRLELYSSSGQSLANYGASTDGQTVTYTFATPGNSFYVRFSGWDGIVLDNRSSGSYSFTISNLYANDAYAPNHKLATANSSVAFDQVAKGVLVSQYEDDWFKFTNPTSDSWNSYTISLTNVGENLYGAFSFYAESAVELKSFKDISSKTKGADVTYTLVSKENVFYVRVSGWDGVILDHRSSGEYDLKVICNGNDSNEPDDTFEQARVIDSFPSGDLSGTILSEAANDNGGDYEFFKVSLAVGKKVAWSIAPEKANTELHFHVYDQGKELQGSVDGNDGQTITGSLNNSGTTATFFYIKLGAFLGDNGNYTISFTETDAD